MIYTIESKPGIVKKISNKLKAKIKRLLYDVSHVIKQKNEMCHRFMQLLKIKKSAIIKLLHSLGKFVSIVRGRGANALLLYFPTGWSMI